jgi:membrane protein DedA with SNARE-associated domain
VGFYFGENQALMQNIFSQVSHVIMGIVIAIVVWVLYRRYKHRIKA